MSRVVIDKDGFEHRVWEDSDDGAAGFLVMAFLIQLVLNAVLLTVILR